MNFLAPLFMLGVLAVGAPILFHLIRRTIREKQVFSSLMFLLPTPPRITRQNRLENLLLLLLRCLVIGLLALAFSRPFLQKPMPEDPTEGQTKWSLILIDTSASMQREDLWAQAIQKAQEAVDQASPTESIAVYTFDRTLHPVWTFERSRSVPSAERNAMVRQELSRLKPGWGAASVSKALLSASELLDNNGQSRDVEKGSRRLVLISDLAEGSHWSGVQGHEWPKHLALEVQAVRARRPTNAGLQVTAPAGDEEASMGSVLRLRVSNSSDAQREQFKLRVESAATNTAPLDLYVPPGQSRILSTVISNAVGSRIRLQGDDADFDNTVYWIPPTRESIRVLYFGDEAPADPNRGLYYLLRAFTRTKTQEFEVLQRSPKSIVSDADLSPASLLVASEELSPELARGLREAVEKGKTLLYVMKSPAVASSVSTLLGVGEISLEMAPKRNFHLLGSIDFQHPLFASFADVRFNDFTRIHFWSHVKMAASALPQQAHVIASFDDEAPALTEVPVGKGSVLLLSSGWAPAESQLALSTKFVPLLFSILERSRASSVPVSQYVVGDGIPLGNAVTNRSLTMRKPDGSVVAVTGTLFSDTDLPGFYVCPETQVRWAVNLAAEESQTAPISLDQMEKLGLPLAKTLSAEQKAQAKADARLLAEAELENRQKLWRWLIIAGILFVCSETWLASRISGSRSLRSPDPHAPSAQSGA